MESLVVILLFLSVFSFVGAGRQLSKPSTKGGDLSTKNIIILTEDGPKYFKITPASGINGRMSRNNDQSGWSTAVSKAPNQGSQKRVDHFPLKQNSENTPALKYQQGFRRNDKSSLPEVASVERIKSSAGVIAVPLSTSQVDKTASQIRLNSNDIQVNTRSADKNILPNADVEQKRSDLFTEKLINFEQPELPSFVKELSGSIYSIKGNPVIPVETNNPEPYNFGYGIDDGLGSTQFRSESTNGDGVITGNYGYKDYQGVFRHVNYIADKDGFRAVMRTNEPSVLPVDSADVTVIVDPPPPFFIPAKS